MVNPQGLILIPAGGFLMWKGFKRYQLFKLMQAIPTSKVRSIAMGPVEVFGAVERAKELLVAPLTGERCVYWKVMVERYQSGKKGGRWITEVERSSEAHFSLRDKTGAVLVDPKGADIVLAPDKVLLWKPKLLDFFPKPPIPESYFEGYTGKGPAKFDYKALNMQDVTEYERPKERKPGEKASLIQITGYSNSSGSRRYSEWRIEPGSQVYILGTAGDNPFKEEATAVEGVEDVMIQKGASIPFYYISDRPERQISSSMQLEGLGGLAAGAALILLGLVMLGFG